MLLTHEGCDVASDTWNALHMHCVVALPHPKLHLMKPSFMNIHETTFMHILHTMDQTWDYGDLNDGGPSFEIPSYETMITRGTYYGIQILKKLCSYNSCIVGEEQKCINDFGWMNGSIAFGGPYVIEVNLCWWRNKFLQDSYIQILPCIMLIMMG